MPSYFLSELNHHDAHAYSESELHAAVAVIIYTLLIVLNLTEAGTDFFAIAMQHGNDAAIAAALQFEDHAATLTAIDEDEASALLAVKLHAEIMAESVDNESPAEQSPWQSGKGRRARKNKVSHYNKN